MKQKGKRNGLQVAAVCCCLCLLAVGAGVVSRSFERETLPLEQPVTAVQSKSVAEICAAQPAEEQKEQTVQRAPKESPKAENPPVVREKRALAFVAPVEGEIVLGYSTDHAIYDPTLEQYRTNASVSLSAKQGTAVKAAADGVVKEIRQDTQAGNVVTIAHGEDWLTTYGQLEDTVAVKEGERVQQGQKIGAVAAPTKYGVALGDHLDFAMVQNGEPKNPTQWIEKAE